MRAGRRGRSGRPRAITDSPMVRLQTVRTRADDICRESAKLLADGNVFAWFQGRSEFGPRSLGNRSILGDPRRPDMKDKLNRRVKFRQAFRPFAPIVLAERVNDIFEEATKQMTTRKRQAAKAERYGQIRDELREKLRVVLASRITQLDTEQSAAPERVAVLTLEIDAQVLQVEGMDAGRRERVQSTAAVLYRHGTGHRTGWRPSSRAWRSTASRSVATWLSAGGGAHPGSHSGTSGRAPSTCSAAR